MLILGSHPSETPSPPHTHFQQAGSDGLWGQPLIHGSVSCPSFKCVQTVRVECALWAFYSIVLQKLKMWVLQELQLLLSPAHLFIFSLAFIEHLLNSTTRPHKPAKQTQVLSKASTLGQVVFPGSPVQGLPILASGTQNHWWCLKADFWVPPWRSRLRRAWESVLPESSQMEPMKSHIQRPLVY